MAQLVARLNGIQEVTSSNLVSSTTSQRGAFCKPLPFGKGYAFNTGCSFFQKIFATQIFFGSPKGEEEYMITEKSTIKVEVKLCKQAEWQLDKKKYIISLLLLVITAIAMTVFTVLMLMNGSDKRDTYYIIMFVLLLTFLISGFIFLRLRFHIKWAATSPIRYVYQFFADQIIIDIYKAADHYDRGKIYYNEVNKLIKKKDYYYMAIRGSHYPLLKADLTPEEIATIKKYTHALDSNDSTVQAIELAKNPSSFLES